MDSKLNEILDAIAIGVPGFDMDLMVQLTQAIAINDYSFVNATYKALKIVLA
jgi:hypothetical protein